ncbi:MAG: T9SS type A sorting domain-containing protein, partial [Bacteroidales bacterium]|nr:T9SS type A sorting domain-containing protein [Bacteroidales bacterium]
NVENTATSDYDFAVNPATFSIQVNNPEPFSFTTVISTGEIKSGERVTLILTDTFPIVVAGVYDIEVFFNNSVDNIKYDDTLRTNYTSKKFGLPIDIDFSSGISAAFTSQGLNTAHTWEVVRQGTGTDAGVQPVFGDSILSFVGSPGSMTTLSTQRLDLSRTQKPSLSFWYFHDTVPCEDYTEVRITVDGGTTYNTLYSLIKYDAAYGWRQYSMDLPPYAVDQCVILVFEAMEKSRSGNVTQYIDRIRITAKRDIELAEILTLGVPACDMENKEWKLVLSNHTDPVLDYSVTPVIVTLEITGTSNIFTKTLNSGSLAGFSSDTVVLSPTFNFLKDTYPIKAWFTSVLDDTPLNDTLETTVVINPDLSVQLNKVSAPNACLAEKSQVWQEVVLTNTGSVDLTDITLVLQIDTGDIVIATYTTLTGTYTGTIQAMGKDTYRFVNPYTVPWNASYSVRVTANLECNITLSNNVDQITECVDTKDLEIVSIDNPLSSSADNAGSSVQVIATVGNRSDLYPFNSGVSITVWVRNSQGVQTDRFTETTGAIGTLSTTSHTFTQSYTVPEDTVYYLTVYIESNDIYPDNDTIRIKRTTDYTGINTIESNAFTLNQNIPNPATNNTHIDYSVPEAGEVIFHVHSISGQLLYSQTIETKRGTNSLELNTTTFAAGVYFYSMEYKGQRLVKQLIINATN